jgi:hypothetical protein
MHERTRWGYLLSLSLSLSLLIYSIYFFAAFLLVLAGNSAVKGTKSRPCMYGWRTLGMRIPWEVGQQNDSETREWQQRIGLWLLQPANQAKKRKPSAGNATRPGTGTAPESNRLDLGGW